MLWACDQSLPQRSFRTVDLRCTNARTPLTCTQSEDQLLLFKITNTLPGAWVFLSMRFCAGPGYLALKSHMVLIERDTKMKMVWPFARATGYADDFSTMTRAYSLMRMAEPSLHKKGLLAVSCRRNEITCSSEASRLHHMIRRRGALTLLIPNCSTVTVNQPRGIFSGGGTHPVGGTGARTNPVIA